MVVLVPGMVLMGGGAVWTWGWLVFVAWAGAAITLMLVVEVRRSRYLAYYKHNVCEKCYYPLLPPDTPVCPECGKKQTHDAG
jgi:hypothetical protein